MKLPRIAGLGKERRLEQLTPPIVEPPKVEKDPYQTMVAFYSFSTEEQNPIGKVREQLVEQFKDYELVDSLCERISQVRAEKQEKST